MDLLGYIICYFVFVILLWKIIKKTGNSGVEAVFIFIPFVNIVILLRLAFFKWPIEEKLEKYVKEYGSFKEIEQEPIELPDECPKCSSPIPEGAKKCIVCNWTSNKS